ncbi:MAG: hypothetical protein IKX40_12175 [Thermoguttaceae bacterium]|nr:hypothetical protein [Thermoguttaceae bacterium]
MSIKHIVTVCGLSFVSLVLCGCPGTSVDTSDFESATNSAESTDQRKTERLFDSAIEALNRLELDSSGESGDRVTGRLNEWIKTTPELKDWAPDPMTPDWQKNVQKNLPFINHVAQQVQFARQDVSQTYDKCYRLVQLQQDLNALIHNQQAGATDQNTLDKIAKIQEEGDKINAELEKYQTPESVKKLLEYLPKIRLFLADESVPDFDSMNLEAFDAFAKFVSALDEDGLKFYVNVPSNETLGLLDYISSWLKGIAGDFALEDLAFPESDINYLEESIWLRDASEWAQGTSADDLSRVMSLFDWTMKNIALETITEGKWEEGPSCRPLWKVLLTGQGTVEERAWVFARLAEHQGLDVALVRVPVSEKPIPPAPAESTAPAEATAPVEEQPAAPAEETVPKNEEEKNEENAVTEEKTEENNVEEKAEEKTEEKPIESDSSSDETESETPASEQTVTEEKTENPAPEQEEIEEVVEEPKAPEEMAFPDLDKIAPQTPDKDEAQNPAVDLPELPDVVPPERLLVAWIDEDKLYFFDPEYGLPIPAPNGVTLSLDAQDKGLKIMPATLEQILADESVLNKMSFTDSNSKERKYYLKPEDFKNAEYYLPVNPTSLSKRMWILQSRLTGEQKMRLTSSPSEIKSRLEKLVPGASVTLWQHSYAVPMFCPIRACSLNILDAVVNFPFSGGSKPLLRARITHLKGTLAPQNEDDDCAVTWYQRSRISKNRIALLANSKGKDEIQFFVFANQYATYWLGLLSDALDNHEAAEEYFNLIIHDKNTSDWMAPAMYNIGRVEEETGQFDKAIDSYQTSDRESRLYIGAALRAQWLKELK